MSDGLPSQVDDLSARGLRLWEELVTEDATEAFRALALEACRTVDRLDTLERAIAADGIADLVESRDDVFEVRIDSAVAEARQQGQALKNLLIEISRRQSEKGAPDDDALDGL